MEISQELMAKIRRIEWRTRRVVDTVLAGQYHARFKGHGMQFKEYREYTHGDDVRHLAWNLTARLSQPYIKQFEEERELSVLIVMDTSASLFYGSDSISKRDVAAEICASLAFAAIKNQDRIGFLSFNDSPDLSVPMKKGRRHVLRLVREVLAHEPKKAGTSLDEAFKAAERLMVHAGIIFVISDFYGSFTPSLLGRCSRKNDVILIRIQDKNELQPPSTGLTRLVDLESGGTQLHYFSPSRVKRWKKSADEDQLNFLSTARRNRASVLQLGTEGDHLDRLVSFFQGSKRGA